ncbi:hypothetical protein NKH48_17515 [Mesorhizobium sp. M1233]|uniref:hypothetical protein n=1 Tax=Mesorhizobium sp. M1233 TaxID=2957072 RepID=UPI0033393658
MADTPVPVLDFSGADSGSCAACGERRTILPLPLLDAGNDIDLPVRDFDGFRRFMLEELAARYPERTRWTPADMEVVLVEALATVLDQLSDMADRAFAEAYLETARIPSSVRRLLSMIGYDAAAEASAKGQIGWDPARPEERFAALENFWAKNPYEMDEARRAGPRAIRTQHRMVSLNDHAERVEDHPLVLRAKARSFWTGSWETIFVAVVAFDTRLSLGSAVPLPADATNEEERLERQQLIEEIERFNKRNEMPLPDWSMHPTLRQVLAPFVERMRMAGREVVLDDAIPVGIALVMSIIVRPNYFRSEVQSAAKAALSDRPGGLFEPGRLNFGDDLFASDIIAALMALDGVENVCLFRFKRVGNDQPDQTASGRIALDGLEIPVCDNNPARLERGYLSLTLHGGLSG